MLVWYGFHILLLCGEHLGLPRIRALWYGYEEAVLFFIKALKAGENTVRQLQAA